MIADVPYENANIPAPAAINLDVVARRNMIAVLPLAATFDVDILECPKHTGKLHILVAIGDARQILSSTSRNVLTAVSDPSATEHSERMTRCS